MKKIVILLGLFPIALFSQNETDALRYSQNYFGGTSRFVTSGSAFSSIAADMSAISINPAALGKYKGSELTITPAFVYNKTSANYRDGIMDDFKFRFQMSNFGIVATHNNGDDVDWRTVSFAFTYNRINDFNRNINIDGYNNESSMTDYFAALANGKKVDQMNGFMEGLAWEAYLIDPDTTGTYKYKSALSRYGARQAKNIDTRGGMGEYVFAIGGNYKDLLQLGMSLGIQSVRYREISDYAEIDEKDSIPSFNSFRFSQELKTTGSGFNFKFGLIYSPIPWFKLGLGLHTPTFFNLSDSYSSSIQSSFNDTLHGDGKVIKSKQGYYDYELTTPFRAIASTGFVFYSSDDDGVKKPLASIAVEYEYVDYSIARLRANDYTFRDENMLIERAYTAVGNIRVGAEYRISSIFLRSGFGYYPSAFKKGLANDNSVRYTYSLGIGIKGDNSYLDIGFIYSQHKEKYFLYDPSVIPNVPASLTHSNMGIITTLGFRF
ncbi:MAG: outer membrane protein transport protein [Bacteroidales bacterium]|nr:outer membrane protein transport protein [Bacteroidales bacterium]